jgi:membrane protein implicated in regulation of membrane protease activity
MSKALDTVAVHRSAVQPILWALIIVGGGCMTGMAFMPPPFNFVCAAILLLLVIAFLAAYFFFMFKDPDRLHSEEFQTCARALEVISSKGGLITFNPVDLHSITNPKYAELPHADSPDGGSDE